MIERAVLKTDRSRCVSLRRHYDSTPEDVWEAWTSPVRLRRWLGEVTGDLSEGGTLTLDMGEGESATIEIIRCDAPHRLVVNWSDPNVPDTTAHLRISADGERTLVEFEHIGHLDSDATRSFGEGWEDFLDRLGELLAGSAVTSRPWDEVTAALDPHWNPLAEAPTRDDRWPTVTPDGARVVIAAHRTYAAAPQNVWNAITDPKRLGAWFADVDTSDSGPGDDQEGRSWRAVFTNGAAAGTIRECTTGRELVTTWKWDHEDTGSVLHVTLEPVGEGTLLRIEQRDAPTDGASGYGAGWYAMLASLTIHLDGRKPTEADWEADFALAQRTVAPFTRARS